jgi:hypothetical protein
MPPNRIHGIFTSLRYGVSGKDLHTWIDRPSEIFGKEHRIYRHDYSMWIPQKFVNRYGLKLARAIVRSHIWLDKNWHWLKDKVHWY